MAETNGLLDPTKMTANANLTASTRQVQDNELASFQLNKITANDSLMKQRSKAESDNYMTSRGMLNTGTAAGSAFGAFVDRAAPIAMFDADRYGKTADANQGYENQFKMADKQFGQTGLLQKDNQNWQSSENLADRAHQSGMQDKDHTFQSGENSLNRDFQKAMQASEFSWRSGENAADRELNATLSQNSIAAQAAEAEKNRAQATQNSLMQIEAADRQAAQQYEQQIAQMGFQLELNKLNIASSTQVSLGLSAQQQLSAIQMDPDLTPEQKRAASQNIIDSTNSIGQAIAVSNGVDIQGFALPGTESTSLNPGGNKTVPLPTTTKTPTPVIDSLSNPAQSYDVDGMREYMIMLARERGYNATQSEVDDVLGHAMANNMDRGQVYSLVLSELRRIGAM